MLPRGANSFLLEDTFSEGPYLGKQTGSHKSCLHCMKLWTIYKMCPVALKVNVAIFFLLDESSQHCRVCSGKCAECDISPNHCTSCRAGMELFKNRCLSLEETCPAGECHGTIQKHRFLIS